MGSPTATSTTTVPELDDRWFDLPALAKYSGLSTRTLRRYLTDAVRPLPHSYVRGGGKDRGRTLVFKRDFDEWVRRFGPAPTERTDALDDRVARALRRGR